MRLPQWHPEATGNQALGGILSGHQDLTMHRVPMGSLAPVYRALSVGTAVPFAKCSGQGDDLLSGWVSPRPDFDLPNASAFP